MKYLYLIFLVVLTFQSQQGNAFDKVEETAITKVALDYGEGWYAGDADRMASALHEKLAKRALLPVGNNKYRLDDMGKKTLVEYTRIGGGKNVPKDQRRTEVVIYDVAGNSAIVKLTMHGWVDFLQLIKENRQWKIINVLWELHPK